MSKWPRVAIDRLPMLQREIAEAADYYALWIKLHSELMCAYDESPSDDGLIDALYSCASYCLLSPDSDLSTAVAYCFYEHLPLDPSVRRDVARWLSAEDFEGLRDVFSYHLDKEALKQFADEFYERKTEISKEAAQAMRRQQEERKSG